MSRSISLMRKQMSSFTVMKGSGEGKKEQLQPYKEGSDRAERNSLQWLWPDGLKLGAKAWDSKSWEMGQGSECWHQLEQDMAGLVFLQCARGFTFSESFPLAPTQWQEPQHPHAPFSSTCWGAGPTCAASESHCSEIPPSGEHLVSSQWTAVYYLLPGWSRKNILSPLL